MAFFAWRTPRTIAEISMHFGLKEPLAHNYIKEREAEGWFTSIPIENDVLWLAFAVPTRVSDMQAGPIVTEDRVQMVRLLRKAAVESVHLFFTEPRSVQDYAAFSNKAVPTAYQWVREQVKEGTLERVGEIKKSPGRGRTTSLYRTTLFPS